jgi:valacyclovir hydrolase
MFHSFTSHGVVGTPQAWAAIVYSEGGKVCQDEAQSIHCPTLVMHGGKDPICLPEHPQWFHDNIPGAKGIQMRVFPEGKHNFHLRFAEEFNSAVGDFITSVRSTA